MGGRPEPPGWHGTARPRPSLASAQQLRGDFGRDRPEVKLVLYLIHRPRLCSSAPAAAAEGKFLVAAGGSGEHRRRCRRLPRIPPGRRGRGPACPGVLQTTLVAPGSLPVSGLRVFPLRSPGRFTPLRLSHPQFLSRNPGVLQGRITNFYPFGTRFTGQWAVSPVGRAPAKVGRGKNGEGSSPAPGRGR